MVIIRKNFGLKALSLALAILGWSYFRFASNPVLGPGFEQQLSVPIAAANLPVGFIAHYTEKEAVVTVEQKRGEPAVKPDEIKAIIELGNKGPGVYNVPVQLVAPDVSIKSLSPASVGLTIEKIDDRSYPLSLHYSGQSSSLVVNDSSMDPTSVRVQGPTSLLQQVTAVRVEVPVPTSPTDIDSMVRPSAVDQAGQEIGGLVVSPDLVRVQVHFVKGNGATIKP